MDIFALVPEDPPEVSSARKHISVESTALSEAERDRRSQKPRSRNKQKKVPIVRFRSFLTCAHGILKQKHHVITFSRNHLGLVFETDINGQVVVK